MKIDVLGVAYEIAERLVTDDPRLEEANGYCDWTERLIVVEKNPDGDLGDMAKFSQKVLRHEITHAFLAESGLNECSAPTESWSNNEEMVDWFARIGPRIYAAWQASGAV